MIGIQQISSSALYHTLRELLYCAYVDLCKMPSGLGSTSYEILTH